MGLHVNHGGTKITKTNYLVQGIRRALRVFVVKMF